MRISDYYRHRNILFAWREVTFAKREDTIEFLSILFSEYYKTYLHSQIYSARTTAERQDYQQRLSSEVMLVESYVKFYLEERIPHSDEFFYKLARKFKPDPEFEVADNGDSLYDYVLKRLHRTADVAVASVFPVSKIFTIVGDKKVRIR